MAKKKKAVKKKKSTVKKKLVELEAVGIRANSKTGLPDSPLQQVRAVPEDAMDSKVLVEREVRRYVRKIGGYRKGLSKKDQERADYLLGLLNRKEIAWDTSITVPGIDQPTVANIQYSDTKRD